MSNVQELSGVDTVSCVEAQLHDSDANEQHSYGLRPRQGKRQVAMTERQTRDKKQKVMCEIGPSLRG
jgi:hypothetical protein